MVWVRVDDAFYDHRKFTEAGPLGLSLWITGMAYCNRNLTDGFLSVSKARRLVDFDGLRDSENPDLDLADDAVAGLLLAGLWHAPGHNCPECPEPARGEIVVHDYLHYQPSAAEVQAGKEAKAEAGRKGAETRWGKPTTAQPSPPKMAPPMAPAMAPPMAHTVANPVANPWQNDAPEPGPVPKSKKLKASRPEPPVRADVERLCDHLADRIEANGSKRPSVTKAWQDAARLMIDADQRTEDGIHKAIDWCQNDGFWKANVMSMPKLREKYDQLRLIAARPPSTASPPASTQPTSERKAAAIRAAGEALRADLDANSQTRLMLGGAA